MASSSTLQLTKHVTSLSKTELHDCSGSGQAGYVGLSSRPGALVACGTSGCQVGHPVWLMGSSSIQLHKQ